MAANQDAGEFFLSERTRGGVGEYTETEVITISYLSDLVPGETAFIYKVSEGDLCARLCELGFVSGTRVECVATAPLGGPCAYLVRGALIALRRDDAGLVDVQRIPSASIKRPVGHRWKGSVKWD